MPTYEYCCTQCGEHVEVVQSFRDDPLTECALCGGALRKVFGNVGILFKGSGFYKTDNPSRPRTKEAAGGEAAKSSAGDGAAASSGSASAKDGAGSKEPAAATPLKAPASTTPAAAAG